MCADTRGVDDARGAFEGEQGKFTPKSMQRAAENFRHLLLKSAAPALTQPRHQLSADTGSTHGRIAGAWATISTWHRTPDGAHSGSERP